MVISKLSATILKFKKYIMRITPGGGWGGEAPPKNGYRLQALGIDKGKDFTS